MRAQPCSYNLTIFRAPDTASRSGRVAYNILPIPGTGRLVQLPGIGTASCRHPASLSSGPWNKSPPPYLTNRDTLYRAEKKPFRRRFMPRKPLDRRRAEPITVWMVQLSGGGQGVWGTESPISLFTYQNALINVVSIIYCLRCNYISS